MQRQATNDLAQTGTVLTSGLWRRVARGFLVQLWKARVLVLSRVVRCGDVKLESQLEIVWKA
jgi:hypothetical protein